MPKLEAIFLALCNSPIIASRLHFTENFYVQCTGSFFILWFTWVVILPLFQIISLSRILVGSNSKVTFIFWCYEFNALQSSSVSFFFFWHRYHSDITLVKKRFWRFHYILFHLANINIQKNNRYPSSHWTAINLFDWRVVCKKNAFRRKVI